MTIPQNKSVLIAIVFAVAITLWLLSGIFKSEEEKVQTSVTIGHEHKDVKVLIKNQQAVEHGEYIRLFGKTKADRDVDLKVETSGRIAEVLIEKGAMVKEGDVIARLAMDDREHRLKSAQALVRQRQLEFDANKQLSQKSFRSQTKLAEADALLNAARAELEQIKLDIEHTEIKAPFDGKLEERTIEIGDYVSAGSNVAKVIDLTPLVIRADIAEADIAKIADGQTAEILINRKPPQQGIVRYVGASSDASTRTYPIEIEVDNLEGVLAAGQTAQVRLKVGAQMAHLVSPAILTLSDKGEIGVKTLDKDQQVQFHKITMLEDTSNGIWITGLPQEAIIIIRGQEYVSAGQKVIGVEEGAISSESPAPDLAQAQGN